jgi:hypothetical protein
MHDENTESTTASPTWHGKRCKASRDVKPTMDGTAWSRAATNESAIRLTLSDQCETDTFYRRDGKER